MRDASDVASAPLVAPLWPLVWPRGGWSDRGNKLVTIP